MTIRMILLLCALLSNSPVIAAENDFDKVCSYFVRLEKVVSESNISNLERAEFISGLVKKELEVTSPAREAWEVIIYAVSNERYDIYKETAEEILNKKWKCPAMQNLIASTGE